MSNCPHIASAVSRRVRACVMRKSDASTRFLKLSQRSKASRRGDARVIDPGNY
jgi:hypothetical protein